MKPLLIVLATVLGVVVCLLVALVVGSIWVARLDVSRTPAPEVRPPFFRTRVSG
jgi:hypothetical protein